MELDAYATTYEGWLYIYDNALPVPLVASLTFPKDAEKHSQKIVFDAVDVSQAILIALDNIRKVNPNVIIPNSASLDFTVAGDRIDARWATEIGTNGTAQLHRVNGELASTMQPLPARNWQEFRAFVRKIPQYQFIFRGQQSNTWRLRTSFHRTERSDMLRYLRNDVQVLYQHLSSMLPHYFNQSDPVQHAAFLSICQHHGFPTPLLDWTYSPFIAAYFAFQEPSESELVRIFLFDKEEWQKKNGNIPGIAPMTPHFTVLNASSFNNPRMIPQQALSTVTNLEDIESYVRECEVRDSKTYLQAIDLPSNERFEVLSELSMMGIGAGSLFPGLDGACKQLRDRLFGYAV